MCVTKAACKTGRNLLDKMYERYKKYEVDNVWLTDEEKKVCQYVLEQALIHRLRADEIAHERWIRQSGPCFEPPEEENRPDRGGVRLRPNPQNQIPRTFQQPPWRPGIAASGSSSETQPVAADVPPCRYNPEEHGAPPNPSYLQLEGNDRGRIELHQDRAEADLIEDAVFTAKNLQKGDLAVGVSTEDAPIPAQHMLATNRGFAMRCKASQQTTRRTMQQEESMRELLTSVAPYVCQANQLGYNCRRRAEEVLHEQAEDNVKKAEEPIKGTFPM